MSIIVRPMLVPSWVDYVGGMRDSFWTTQTRSEVVPSDLIVVGTAAAALSNAGQLSLIYQIPLIVGTSAVSAAYTITDAATFYLQSAAGLNGVVSIPDPKPSIFKTDGVTVDQTVTSVATFLTSVFAKLGDTAGNPWTTVRQANRTKFPG